MQADDVREGDCLEESLRRCLMREMREELVFDGEPKIELCGFVNDETIEAGRFHVAAFHRVHFCGGKITVRPGVSDQEFGENSWALVDVDKIISEHFKYDPWSRHVIHHLFDGPPVVAQRLLDF